MQRARARSLFVIIVACVGLVASNRACRGELVYFRNGGEAQLPATIEDHRVLLTMPDGKVTLAREGIRRASSRDSGRPTEWPARYNDKQPHSDSRHGSKVRGGPSKTG